MAISIACIIILGLCGDYLFRRMKLPGLVEMLLVGMLIGPCLLNLISPEMMTVSGDFRKIAIIVILLRAGFELRRDTLCLRPNSIAMLEFESESFRSFFP